MNSESMILFFIKNFDIYIIFMICIFSKINFLVLVCRLIALISIDLVKLYKLKSFFMTSIGEINYKSVKFIIQMRKIQYKQMH